MPIKKPTPNNAWNIKEERLKCQNKRHLKIYDNFLLEQQIPIGSNQSVDFFLNKLHEEYPKNIKISTVKKLLLPWESNKYFVHNLIKI
jgi:hypothetical protein